MSIYTVHVPAADLDRPLAASRAAYVREGFAWMAFLFAPLWCVARRSWLGLAIWCGAVAIIVAFGRTFAMSGFAIAGAIFVLHILFGFEAAQLRRRSLARRGYAAVDVVSADNRRDAEMVFDIRRTAAVAAPAAAPAPAVAAVRPRPISPGESYGLAPLGGGA